MVPLGEVAEIVSGATPKTGSEQYWGGDILWATPADLSKLNGPYIDSTPRKITEAGLKSCAAQVLPAGSVLLSSRAPIGHVAINTKPMATNQGFKSLIPRPDLADAKYLYHWLRANTNFLQSLGNGATFKEVSKSVVSKVEIGLPPLDEQRRIAAILDRAAAIGARQSRARSALDELQRALFLDMFGDPVGNECGWETATMGDVCLRITDGEHKTPRRSGGGVPLLSARSVQQGWIDFDATDFVPEDEYEVLRRRIEPAEGDVLISCSGTIGRVAPVRTNSRFAMVRSVALVRPGPRVSSGFLQQLLSNRRLNQMMNARANSSAQANLFQNQIKSLPVILPPLATQENFDARIAEVQKMRKGMSSAAIGCGELLASLQSRAFSGQL